MVTLSDDDRLSAGLSTAITTPKRQTTPAIGDQAVEAQHRSPRVKRRLKAVRAWKSDTLYE